MDKLQVFLHCTVLIALYIIGLLISLGGIYVTYMIIQIVIKLVSFI